MRTERQLSDTAGSEEADGPVNELLLPIWSVISFEQREGSKLSYFDAVAMLETLEAKGVVGLCIVTDDAAARTRTDQN